MSRMYFLCFLFIVIAIHCTSENSRLEPKCGSSIAAVGASNTELQTRNNNESLYSRFISVDSAIKILEPIESDTTFCNLDSLNLNEHSYTYPEDVDFDFIQAYKAHKIVLNKLLKHQLILKNIDNGLEIESFDLIQNTFNFRQTVPSLDPNIGRVIAGWWSYHTKTGKVFNDILFEELK